MAENVPQDVENAVILPHGDTKWWKIVTKKAYGKPKKLKPMKEMACFEEALSSIIGNKVEALGMRVVVEKEGKDFEDEFFSKILPYIVELAIVRAPKLFPTGKIPALIQQVPQTVVLSRLEAAALIAQGFLSLNFNHQRGPSNRPYFDFIRLTTGFYPPSVAKLRMILNYFSRLRKLEQESGVDLTKQRITYSRRLVEPKDMPNWGKSEKLFSEIKIEVSDKNIEEIPEAVAMDFANKFIGGGVLGGGAVQEEILFCTNPECLPALLFCQVMEPNEAIFIFGAEKFSKEKGYGRSLQYGGDFVDDRSKDDHGRIDSQILALDALQAYSMDVAGQLACHRVLRELDKLYAGWKHRLEGEKETIATGNWGCGAFGGDHSLKAILQFMAGAICERNLVYCTFQNEKLSRLQVVVNLFQSKEVSVGDVYHFLEEIDVEEFRGDRSFNLLDLAIKNFSEFIKQ